MIEKDFGWSLAPAYDLLNVSIANPKDDDELALTLNGKRKRLKKSDFVLLGSGLGLSDKQIGGVFMRLTKNKGLAMDWINRSFLSDAMKEDYKGVLRKRYAQLEIED